MANITLGDRLAAVPFSAMSEQTMHICRYISASAA